MVTDSWQPAGRVWWAAGALFRNEIGDVLLVEPIYKPTWEIPGGIVEAGESPAAACRREVAEELGLDVSLGRLLCVDFASPPFASWEGLRFVFDGWLLPDAKATSIRLQSKELASWRFSEVSFGFFMGFAMALGAHRLIRGGLSQPVEDVPRIRLDVFSVFVILVALIWIKLLLTF